MYLAGDKVKVIKGKYEGAEGTVLGQMNATVIVKIGRGSVYIKNEHLKKIS